MDKFVDVIREMTWKQVKGNHHCSVETSYYSKVFDRDLLSHLVEPSVRVQTASAFRAEVHAFHLTGAIEIEICAFENCLQKRFVVKGVSRPHNFTQFLETKLIMQLEILSNNTTVNKKFC